MLRNAESHFSQVPQVDMPRSTFGRPFNHQLSCNVGELIPLYVDTDILPGDTVKVTTSKVLRLQTLLTPTFGNMWYDTFWFFVPHRLVWTHWKEFCKENTESAWIPTTEYQIPTIASPESGFDYGTIADFMGFPCKTVWDNTAKRRPHALGLRAYALICNEFFRWTPVTDPLSIPTGDSNQTGSNGSNYITDVANGGKPFIAAKAFDYFTSCLPSPQRGPTVSFNLSNESEYAPVIPRDKRAWAVADVDFPHAVYGIGSGNNTIWSNNNVITRDSNGITESADGEYTFTGSHNTVQPVNFWADLTGFAESITVSDLRLAFQLQKFYERLALGGDRYISVIRSMFGVSSGDARLQRPEYLGGNRIPIQIHEITNSAQTSSDFLGDVGAKSATSDVHFDIDASFTEHGTLICLGVCRYEHSYEGLSAMWSRRKFTDLYWPVFCSLSNLPVYDSEIYADATTIANDSVFGYQEAWASYRYQPNRVSNLMRPSHPQTLSSWNLADSYSVCPTLSDSWIREDKTNVDRTLAVISSTSDQLFGDFFFDAVYTRVMPMYSVPGLIDHF